MHKSIAHIFRVAAARTCMLGELEPQSVEQWLQRRLTHDVSFLQHFPSDKMLNDVVEVKFHLYNKAYLNILST